MTEPNPAPKRTPWSHVPVDGLFAMVATFANGIKLAESQDQPEAAAALTALRDLGLTEIEQRIRTEDPRRT